MSSSRWWQPGSDVAYLVGVAEGHAGRQRGQPDVCGADAPAAPELGQAPDAPGALPGVLRAGCTCAGGRPGAGTAGAQLRGRSPHCKPKPGYCGSSTHSSMHVSVNVGMGTCCLP